MQNVTKEKIANLIALTPNIQENEVILNQLHELADSLNVVEEPFHYTNTLVAAAGGAANALAAGAQSAQIITAVDASAMFIIESQSYLATVLNAAQNLGTYIAPNVTVMITDSGTSKNWMDQPVPIPAIFGTGQFPFVLPRQRVIPAAGNIICVYTNFDAAAGYNIRLVFNGYRLYQLSRR